MVERGGGTRGDEDGDSPIVVIVEVNININIIYGIWYHT